MDSEIPNEAGPASPRHAAPPTAPATSGRALLLAGPAIVAILLASAPAKASDAPPPPPLPAPLAAAEAVEPSGARVELSPSTEAVVDPASTFRVVLPGRSDDARLSLLDAADALVPSTGTREVGDQTVLGITPRQPLVPASRYLLRVDGARERDLHDEAGRAAGPVELHLVAAGSPPEKPAKAVRKKKRRR